jgi:hypothetical protein
MVSRSCNSGVGRAMLIEFGQVSSEAQDSTAVDAEYYYRGTFKPDSISTCCALGKAPLFLVVHDAITANVYIYMAHSGAKYSEGKDKREKLPKRGLIYEDRSSSQPAM